MMDYRFAQWLAHNAHDEARSGEAQPHPLDGIPGEALVFVFTRLCALGYQVIIEERGGVMMWRVAGERY